jgi:hypothetical protein
MATAATAVGSASGLRAWLGARFGSRLGERGLRRLTLGLFGAAVVASGLFLGGSG